MRIRPTLSRTRRRNARRTPSLSDALNRAATPSARAELEYLQRMR